MRYPYIILIKTYLTLIRIQFLCRIRLINATVS
nr:MAG TPA: hypothetical protein [Caudoviricetes sp.]